MIGERHVGSAVARAAGISIMGSEVLELIYDLRWMVLLSLVLIATDFWFGVSESKMLGKDVIRSKAWRRTLNKVVDYMCYLMLAGVLGMAIGEPMGIGHLKVAVVVMLFTCAWELDSIYGHICVLNGATKDFSIRKFIFGIFKRKTETIKEAAEEAKVTEEQVTEAKTRAGFNNNKNETI